MAKDLQPDQILNLLEKGQLGPFYLFYGPGEFRIEKVIEKIREDLIPESARDFNLEVFYGGETDPAEIIERTRSIPFMAQKRLNIVRRTENFKAEILEKFIPYLEDPVESTCLIFISGKTEFNRKFYKFFRKTGNAVEFSALRDNQVVPWIKRMAKQLDLNIEADACLYLQQVIGNQLREIFNELEKLSLSFGKKGVVGVEEVRELAVNSRIYNIFELMKSISMKKRKESLGILMRFLEEEDNRGGTLRILGMLNRQLRLLWQTKIIVTQQGGNNSVVAKKLSLPPFSAKEFINQSKLWTANEIEKGLALLYRADHLLKSGSQPKLVIENLIISLCKKNV